MYFFTTEQWTQKNISDPIHQFFYLRWKELFEEQTYLSWQLRTSDLKTILSELHESLDITNEAPMHHPNILTLIQELVSTSKNYKALLELKPQLDFLFKQLENIYNQKLKSSENKNIKIFKSVLNKIDLLLEDSKDILINEISNIIDNKINKKAKLDEYTSLLATILKNEGYSYFYLKEQIRVLDHKDDFTKCFNRFKTNISREIKPNKCYFMIRSIHLNDKSLISKGTNIYKFVDKSIFTAITNKDVENFLKQNIDGVIVEISTNSLDVFSSIAQSNTIINEILCVSSLYSKNDVIQHIHDKVLVCNPNGNYRLINENKYKFKDVIGTNSFIDTYLKYSELISSLQNNEKSLIISSLNFFKLSKSSNDDNLKFLNLWIALEALFQDNDGNSIIGRIKYSLPQIISTYYISDLIRDMSLDINRNSEIIDFKIIEKYFKNSTPKKINSSDLLEVLTDIKDGDKIKSLLSYSSNNSLLVYRVYKVWKEYFQDNDALSSKIKKHKNNVEWQLMRLYRIRNGIMHKGKVSFDLTHYIHHLNHYYQNVMHAILDSFIKDNSRTVIDCLSEKRENFNYIENRISTKQNISAEELYLFDPDRKCTNILWNRH